MFPTMLISGVRRVIYDLFVSGSHRIVGHTFSEVVVKALTDHPEASKLIFNSKAKLQPVQMKRLVLLLIAANILDCVYHLDDKDHEEDELLKEDHVRGKIILMPTKKETADSLRLDGDNSFLGIPYFR